MKKIAGSILIGLSLIAEVINEWLHHYFWVSANMAKGISLLGGGQFQAPTKYGDVISYPFESLNIFLVTRILIWTFIGLGIVLIVWGILEDMKKSE